MEKMEHLVKELEMDGVNIQLLDQRGVIVYPRDKKDMPDTDFSSLLWHGNAAMGPRFSYCRMGRDILRFTSGDQMPVLAAIARMATQSAQSEEAEPTRESLLLRILHMGYVPQETDADLVRLNIDPDAERCVVVFHVREDTPALMRALAELFGEKSPDVVISRRSGTVILVKAMKGLTLNELTELAMAVAETMGEAGVEVIIGVGEPKKGLAQLAESYQEATLSLELGRIAHPERTVFLHRQMILERLINEIPPETAQRYHQILFSRKNMRLLNDEMVATIDRFFACNLNLSEAARQLYIHRNTLVYRLDKFQKATGLDLRVFDDAVAFKLLRMMGSLPIKRMG